MSRPDSRHPVGHAEQRAVAAQDQQQVDECGSSSRVARRRRVARSASAAVSTSKTGSTPRASSQLGDLDQVRGHRVQPDLRDDADAGGEP